MGKYPETMNEHKVKAALVCRFSMLPTLIGKNRLATERFGNCYTEDQYGLTDGCC